jgi:hypothetical protein
MPDLKDEQYPEQFCVIFLSLKYALSSGEEAEFPEIWYLRRAKITKIAVDIATMRLRCP